MLNLRQRQEDTRANVRPMSEILPWMTHAAPDTVLCKDGSFLVGYEFSGIDMEGSEPYMVNQLTQSFENALRVFDENTILWQTTLRRRTSTYPESEFANEWSEWIDQQWRQRLSRGRQYYNRHYLFILRTLSKGADSFMDSVNRLTTRGVPTGKAVVQSMRDTLSYRGRFVADSVEMIQRLRQMEDQLSNFEDGVRVLGMKRLQGAVLDGTLHALSSPASSRDLGAINMDTKNYYMDTMLGADTVTITNNRLRFDGTQGQRLATAFSIKTWPSATFPGVLDSILDVDAELTVSQCYRIQDPEKAKKWMETVRTHNLNWSKSFFTMIKEAATNTESDKVNNDRIIKANDADQALSNFSQHRMAGYYNLTVAVYGDDHEDLERASREVNRSLQRESFVAIKESLHLLSAWAGTIPGQWGETVRWAFFMGPNMADAAHLRTAAMGNAENTHLSKQRGRPTPALTMLETDSKTPFFFNFHQGDLGHTFVVGPSRSGKSAFTNFLISQFRKYHPCNVYIFDKDNSCTIPTLLQGGDEIDPSSGKMKLNPLVFMDTPEDMEWLAGWLEILVGSRGHNITSSDAKAIWNALEMVKAIPVGDRKLESLISLLPRHISEHLESWTGKGPMARYFDHTEDNFVLSDFLRIAMDSLFNNPSVARAFMDYAFRRISKSLDGRPSLIYIEEAWFMLEDEHFSSKVNDWLRTLAKKNVVLMMATQSLEELSQSKAFAAMVDNIPVRIFLSNPNAGVQRELYQGRFALNDTQIDRIATMEPKKDYYVVTPHGTRKVRAHLPKEIVAAVNSTSKALELFNAARAAGGNWRKHYVEEAIKALG